MEFLIHHPVVSVIAKGALVGVLTAAASDYAAFRSWKSYRDFYTYDWGVASFRWLQGAFVGAVAAVPVNWI